MSAQEKRIRALSKRMLEGMTKDIGGSRDVCGAPKGDLLCYIANIDALESVQNT